MRSESDSFAILERALKAAGADEADAAFLSVDQNISRFANSQLHQNMSEESASLTLRVIVDGAMGVATTTAFDEDEIARTATVAREAARHSGAVQGFRGLYRDNEPVPVVDSFDEATATISALEKAQALRTMFDQRSRRALRGRVRHRGDVGRVRQHARRAALRSDDARRRHGHRHRRQRLGLRDATRAPTSKVDMAALGDEATLKATLAADRIEDLTPGAYDVILEPPALAEVFEWMNMIAFTGQSFEDGSSFFVGNLGKRILGENLHGHRRRRSTSYLPFPFDDRGSAEAPRHADRAGIPRTPVLDKAWADRLGLTPTAHAWHLGSPEHGTAFHLTMNGGDSSREEMIASTKLGIWVTRFNYVNGLLEPKTRS
jgi:PmbA protein